MSMSHYARTIMTQRYSHDLVGGRKESWPQIAKRVAEGVFYGAAEACRSITVDHELVRYVTSLIEARIFIPGGRYLAATGRELHQTQNCILLRAEDCREGWGRLLDHSATALMTGAGVGVNYSELRGEGVPLRRAGGFASGPIALMQAINEVGRAAKSGGNRRAALWAGLLWSHPDAEKFIDMKDWPDEIKALKAKDYAFPATMDHTNVSICLDDEFFAAIHDPQHPRHELANRIFWKALRSGLQNGEPGFSVDVGENAGEDLRNACTEVTSRDDSDICNLGSINLAKITDRWHMESVTRAATAFLLAGTEYSHVPYAKIAEVRSKNRRLGLGLMGIHEWLMVRGKRYAPCVDLVPILDAYRRCSDASAIEHADAWGLSRPVKCRAIAPVGTIGGLADTTTGGEPLFSAAYKRRYLEGSTFKWQYVVDPTAKRLVQEGMDPDRIEDAYSISRRPTDRVDFQVWLQQFVDHGISSTINLSPWGSEWNNEEVLYKFGEELLERLPKLRGITMYPDGGRAGQPLNSVPLREALGHEGEVYEEQGDSCSLRSGGSCGA